MSRDFIKLSARAVQELLAGKLSQDDFLKQHQFTPTEERGWSFNPFAVALQDGRLIDRVASEKNVQIVMMTGSSFTSRRKIRRSPRFEYRDWSRFIGGLTEGGEEKDDEHCRGRPPAIFAVVIAQLSLLFAGYCYLGRKAVGSKRIAFDPTVALREGEAAPSIHVRARRGRVGGRTAARGPCAERHPR